MGTNAGLVVTLFVLFVGLEGLEGLGEPSAGDAPESTTAELPLVEIAIGIGPVAPSNKSDSAPPPAARLPKGLGLLLLKLNGLANPLALPPREASPDSKSEEAEAGATTATLAAVFELGSVASRSIEVRTAAALSRTLGTLCSSCSVARPRGMRWGSRGRWEPERRVEGEAGMRGSMSRSKMAEEDEWL